MALILGFPAYFVEFVQALSAEPQLYYAVVIGLFFGIATATKPGLFLVPVIAALVFIAARVIVPVALHHAPLTLPAFDGKLALEIIAAYIVFLIADTAVYLAKKAFLKAID